MTSRRWLPVALVALTSLGWSVQACSSDDANPKGTTDKDASADTGTPDDGTGAPDSSSLVDDAATDDTGSDDASSDDAGSIADASDAATDAGCTDPVAAELNGPEACKALPFGVDALTFVAPDPKGPDAKGGEIPAGVYDISHAERGSAKGSWRETLVIDGKGKFTRTRQIDTGSGNGLGPITHVSGTYATKGNEISFTTECADGGGKPGDKTTLPYGVTTDTCGRASFFFTATGIRVTLTQR